MPNQNRETLEEIAQLIQEKTGEDPIAYVSFPQPSETRVVFMDGTVSLGYGEAVIHAAAILSKL